PSKGGARGAWAARRKGPPAKAVRRNAEPQRVPQLPEQRRARLERGGAGGAASGGPAGRGRLPSLQVPQEPEREGEAPAVPRRPREGHRLLQQGRGGRGVAIQ